MCRRCPIRGCFGGVKFAHPTHLVLYILTPYWFVLKHMRGRHPVGRLYDGVTFSHPTHPLLYSHSLHTHYYILTPYTPNTIFSHPTHPILYSYSLLMCARTYLPKAPSWKDLRWSHILTPYTHNTIFSHPTNNVRAEGAPSESSMVESYCHTPHIGYFILTPYWFVSIHICGRRPVGKYILLHLECHSILI